MGIWTPWKGGNLPPLPRASIVAAKMRDGQIVEGPMLDWEWIWRESTSDIVAYQVLG